MPLNTDLSKMFKKMGVILEIKGANGFKINALLKVADILEDLVEDVSSVSDLISIDGIGKSSASKIKQYIELGHMDDYDELLASIPTGLLDVMKVQGIGPKTVRRLWQEADVADIATLQQAIDDGRLLELPRMGQKTIDNIKDSLEFLATTAQRTNIGKAMPIAKSLII